MYNHERRRSRKPYSYGRRRLYRSRNGNIFGICQGIADWMAVPVGTVRLIVILTAIFTAVLPALLIYLVMAMIIPPEPAGYYRD